MKYFLLKDLMVASLIVMALSIAQARADLVVAVQNTQVQSGGFGKVDVLIEGMPNDLFAIINYEFLITPVGETVGILQFRVPQLSTEILRNDYVLGNDSGAFTSIPHNSPSNDVLIGGDATASGLDVALTSGNSLLVSMDVEHVLPFGVDPRVAVSDEFTITIQNSVNTFFLNATFMAGPAIDLSSFGSAGTGLISMTAVPEPSILGLVTTLAAIVCCLNSRIKIATPDIRAMSDAVP